MGNNLWKDRLPGSSQIQLFYRDKCSQTLLNRNELKQIRYRLPARPSVFYNISEQLH